LNGGFRGVKTPVLKMVKMIKKTPKFDKMAKKNVFFSWYEAACSCSEATNDLKTVKMIKTPKFDKMAKNNVFFFLWYEAACSCSEATNDIKLKHVF